METIHGAPSYTLKTAEVELAVTQTAGHLAPVTFHLPGLKASPYSLSPWTPTQIDQSLPNLLTYLRGDFMCLPFGGQQKGPPHGDTANAPWQLASSSATSLKLTQTGTDTGATVAKNFTLIPGHHAIYWEHIITQLEGRWNYGNHPVLDLSQVPAGAARVATSAFRFGSVYAGEFSNPAAGESGALKPFAEFTTLKSVPMKDGSNTDLTHYPARAGNDDLIMLVNVPATEALLRDSVRPESSAVLDLTLGGVQYQEDRADDAHPADRAGFSRNQPDTPPCASVAEIIGVAGVAPQSSIKHLTCISWVSTKRIELRIADGFEQYADDSDGRTKKGKWTQNITATFACPDTKLRRKAGDEQQWGLCQKHRQKRCLTPTPTLFLHHAAHDFCIARVLAMRAPARPQMQREAKPPQGGQSKQ